MLDAVHGRVGIIYTTRHNLAAQNFASCHAVSIVSELRKADTAQKRLKTQAALTMRSASSNTSALAVPDEACSDKNRLQDRTRGRPE
jgi:hypothetical protein